MKRFSFFLVPILLLTILFLPACSSNPNTMDSYSLANLPAYSGDPYVEINHNQPDFDDADMTEQSFETYSELDDLGRCGVAYANIGSDLMPTEERSSIGSVKPSGWQTAKYDCVDGKYLYNRCHLIGYQLTAENANKQNLITGTRYLNVNGMLPFENMVADYIKETDNHVLYRVTPHYEDDNLIANGVQIEAKSVEDDGEGILFNVYCYNVQPFIWIDYANGNSCLESEKHSDTTADSQEITYILNNSSKKFHKPNCSSVEQIAPGNKEITTDSRESIIESGYSPCGTCKP